MSSTGTIATSANIAMTIDTFGRVQVPNRPYAICKMNSGNAGAYNNAAASATMIPTNVVRNVGNVYSPTTGQFTAPVDGLYEINFSSNIYRTCRHLDYGSYYD